MKSLTSEIGKKIKGEIPCQVFRLSETSLKTVLTEALTLPFLAAAQIFRLREADHLNREAIDSLGEYLQRPASHTFLIFEAESLGKSEPLVKLLREKGEVYFLEDYEKKPAGARFIREKLQQAGKTMTPGAIARLEETAGDAPSFLDSILNQLVACAGTESRITEEMVSALEEKWGSVNVFKFTDAIAGRKTDVALTLLHEILEDSEKDVISLIGLLHWQIRRLWQARILLEAGEGEGAILKKCRIPPGQAGFFMRQFKGFPRRKIEDALEGLFLLDWKLKSGRAESPIALERWVVEATS